MLANHTYAGMAKLVDASALGADESNLVEVRVLFPAPYLFAHANEQKDMV